MKQDDAEELFTWFLIVTIAVAAGRIGHSLPVGILTFAATLLYVHQKARE